MFVIGLRHTSSTIGSLHGRVLSAAVAGRNLVDRGRERLVDLLKRHCTVALLPAFVLVVCGGTEALGAAHNRSGLANRGGGTSRLRGNGKLLLTFHTSIRSISIIRSSDVGDGVCGGLWGP